MLRRWTFLLLLALSVPVGVSGCFIHRDEGEEHHSLRRDDAEERHAFRGDDADRRGYYAPGTYGYGAAPGYYERQ